MKFNQIFVTALFSSICMIGTTTVHAKQTAQITPQQAAEIATKRVGGYVTDVDYKYHHMNKSYYKVEVKTANGQEYDVRINAKTGAVISTRLDHDD